jgi:hypothetical protein
MYTQIDFTADVNAGIETDGTLLPMGAVAVFPCLEEDLAELVTHVPLGLAGKLARMAAWRALGMDAPVPDGFDAK